MGLPFNWIYEINNEMLDFLIKEYHKSKISLTELIKQYIEIKINKKEIINGRKRARK